MTTGRFQKGPNYRTPFGKNEFLGSTDYTAESWTVARTSVPVETIDSATDQQVLQPGTIMAEITSAAGTSTTADIGKVGPFDSGATDGRQTKANIRGICNTFVPWQLMERDVDIAIVVDAWVFSDFVFGYEAAVKKSLTTLVADTILAYSDLINTGCEIRIRKMAARTGTGVLGTDFGHWPAP